MRRSDPLGRSQRLVRRAWIQATNATRRRRAFQRAYGGEGRVAWVQRSPCVITGLTPCEVVHVRTGGMGRKADARWTVPMIPEKHRELHRIGVRSFEEKYGISLAARWPQRRSGRGRTSSA